SKDVEHLGDEIHAAPTAEGHRAAHPDVEAVEVAALQLARGNRREVPDRAPLVDLLEHLRGRRVTAAGLIAGCAGDVVVVRHAVAVEIDTREGAVRQRAADRPDGTEREVEGQSGG